MYDSNEYKHSDLTDLINNAAVTVYDILGYGFLEKIYENAMVIELQKKGLQVEPQKQLIVKYDGKEIGEYYADLIVADKVIVELKACTQLENIHYAQLYNYLKATGIEVGLLINFGHKLTIKRRALYRK